jgi:uncharacterized paraquat-inducible protein A
MLDTPLVVIEIKKQLADVQATLSELLALLKKIEPFKDDEPIPEIAFCRTCNANTDHQDNICQRCGSSLMGIEQ